MAIKHLVLGGGGGGGYTIYGAVKFLSQNNYWNIEDIENIYCVSIGSLISVLISLKLEWDTLDDYLIKRPWDKVINIKPTNLFNLWREKGIFNSDIVKEILSSLLTVKGLSESITLKEFFDYNNIEIHMYTVNINESLPVKIDISYKTHPNLELHKAISMSAAFPILLVPICDNDTNACYIDGGILNNFPLNDCINGINQNEINQNEINQNEILAFKITSFKTPNMVTTESTLINYLYILIDGIRKLVSTENHQTKIENIVNCDMEHNNYNIWKDAILYENVRKEMIEHGEKCGEVFLYNKKKEENIDETLKDTILVNV